MWGWCLILRAATSLLLKVRKEQDSTGLEAGEGLAGAKLFLSMLSPEFCPNVVVVKEWRVLSCSYRHIAFTSQEDAVPFRLHFSWFRPVFSNSIPLDFPKIFFALYTFQMLLSVFNQAIHLQLSSSFSLPGLSSILLPCSIFLLPSAMALWISLPCSMPYFHMQ